MAALPTSSSVSKAPCRTTFWCERAGCLFSPPTLLYPRTRVKPDLCCSLLACQRLDAHTLKGLNWLNDKVINNYLVLLYERSLSNRALPRIWCGNRTPVPRRGARGPPSLLLTFGDALRSRQDLQLVFLHEFGNQGLRLRAALDAQGARRGLDGADSFLRFHPLLPFFSFRACPSL